MRKIILILCLLFALPVLAQEEETTPYEIALQRIEEARLSEATILDLTNLGLSQLPPEVGSLSNLTWLLIEHNNLTSLPPEIGNLMDKQKQMRMML